MEGSECVCKRRQRLVRLVRCLVHGQRQLATPCRQRVGRGGSVEVVTGSAVGGGEAPRGCAQRLDRRAVLWRRRRQLQRAVTSVREQAVRSQRRRSWSVRTRCVRATLAGRRRSVQAVARRPAMILLALRVYAVSVCWRCRATRRQRLPDCCGAVEHDVFQCRVRAVREPSIPLLLFLVVLSTGSWRQTRGPCLQLVLFLLPLRYSVQVQLGRLSRRRLCFVALVSVASDDLVRGLLQGAVHACKDDAPDGGAGAGDDDEADRPTAETRGAGVSVVLKKWREVCGGGVEGAQLTSTRT